MKNLLVLVFLLIVCYSCKQDGSEILLKKIYLQSAKEYQDTIHIDYFEILNRTTVDFDYYKKVETRSLKDMIHSIESMNSINDKKIQLLEKNIQIGNELRTNNDGENERNRKEVEYDKLRLERARIEKKLFEDEIAVLSQKIVLIDARDKNGTEEFELIEYVFKGKINNEIRIDTMSVLEIGESQYKFVQDNLFTDYKGI